MANLVRRSETITGMDTGPPPWATAQERECFIVSTIRDKININFRDPTTGVPLSLFQREFIEK